MSKTNGPVDGLRALAATTNKRVNNYVNNEPDLPVGQITVAGVFFVSKKISKKQKKQKKKNPQKRSSVKTKELHAASIP